MRIEAIAARCGDQPSSAGRGARRGRLAYTQRRHFATRSKHFVVGMLLVLCSAFPAQATVLSGRVGMSTYMWERSEADFTDTRHAQNTGTLSLRFARIADQDLEISTSMRGRYDVRNVGDNLDAYHIYNLRARWRNIAGVADFTGGRQRIYWPTASVSIDGGSAAVRPVRGLELGGYFGVTAPEDGRFKVTDYDDGHAFGAQLRYRNSILGLTTISYAQRNRARSYDTISVDNLASRTLGIDWRRTVKGFGTLYGQLNYETPTERISRVHVSVRWRAAGPVTVNGQFRYRRPSIPYNSIFWVFGDSRYYEGRLRINYRLNATWTFNVGGAYVNLVDGDAERFDLGVAHRYFSVTLHGKSGWSGNTIGISGEARYPVKDRWLLRAGSRFSSYELAEDAPESNLETSSWGGIQWRWMPQSTLDIEGQLLSQDIKTQPTVFTGENYDFRVIARLSWWFFNRLGR